MRVVILAGGLGTRLAEETSVRPKPMVEIGGRPMLWHIMQLYAHHGLGEFVVALGYKGDYIKRYFLDYYHAHTHGAISINLASGRVETEQQPTEDWRVHLVDTGHATNTGGRVARLRERLDGGTFMVTYGDGVSDINIAKLMAFHRSHGRIATVTAVRPPARYGGLIFEGDLVERFTEKPQAGEGWINGGFLVFEPEIFDYLDGDTSSLESNALERLAADRQLAAFKHDGFWQCMDTLRDKNLLERLWQEGRAPWATWERALLNETETEQETEPVEAEELPIARAITNEPVRMAKRKTSRIRIDRPEPVRRRTAIRLPDAYLLD